MRDMNESNLLYFPYKADALTYVIPKKKIEYDTCEYGLPVPPQELWLGYGKTNEEYLFGKHQVEKMLSIINSSEFFLSDGDKILDFGCGAGRMIRWLKPYSNFCEIWGTDISADHIYWANQYLKPPFNFATNTTIPHLPFADNYFNFIYAGSVFTHIDDLADAWLLELRRILSPHGRLYITIQDNNSITELETVPVYQELWIAKFMTENPLFQENKDHYNMIVNGRGPSSQVFYDREIFTQSIKTIYEVLSVNDGAYGFQTGYLLKKN